MTVDVFGASMCECQLGIPSSSFFYISEWTYIPDYSGLVIHSCHRSHAPRNPWSAEFFQAAFALASPSTAPIIQTSFAPAQRFPFCATPHWGGRTDWKMVCGCMSQNGDWHGLAILNMTEYVGNIMMHQVPKFEKLILLLWRERHKNPGFQLMSEAYEADDAWIHNKLLPNETQAARHMSQYS